MGILLFWTKLSIILFTVAEMQTSKNSLTRLKLHHHHLLSRHFTSLAEKQDQEHVLVEENTHRIKMTLNRPKQLNSITVEMMSKISSLMKKANQNQKQFFILGNDKAFCAGGDLKEVLQSSSDKDKFMKIIHKTFGVLFRYATLKPTSVAVCDGYAFGMGGGFLSLSTIRIVTEAAVLSMPQARNGMFSADGFAYACSQLPKYIGKFMTLTGETLKGNEICQAGLADHFVLRKNLPSLMSELDTLLQSGCGVDKLKEVISKYEEKNEPKMLKDAEKLEKYFSDKYLKDIIGKLSKEVPKDPKAEYWLSKIKEGCPLMLLANNYLIENTTGRSLEDCFSLEYYFINKLKTEDASIGLNRLFGKNKGDPTWSMSFEEIQTFNEDELIDNFPSYNIHTLSSQ